MDSDTFLCFDTNVTRIRTFPKQRCLTGTTTHSIRKWFHGSDTFMLGTNVTRIFFVIPFQMFPKHRSLTSTTTHSIRKWFHGSAFILFGTNVTRTLMSSSDVPKQRLTSTTTPSLRYSAY